MIEGDTLLNVKADYKYKIEMRIQTALKEAKKIAKKNVDFENAEKIAKILLESEGDEIDLHAHL